MKDREIISFYMKDREIQSFFMKDREIQSYLLKIMKFKVIYGNHDIFKLFLKSSKI